MRNFEIIDKADIPDQYAGKWTYLFTHLPIGKAVKLIRYTSKEAEALRVTILATLRNNRRKAHNLDFHLVTKIVRLDENEWALFVWKEEKNNGM